MKISRRAFSLAELLIVVVILSIVSVVGFASFSKLSSLWEWSEVTTRISTSLRELEEQIAAKKIDSYEVTFEKNSAGFVINKDFASLSASGGVSFDWENGTGSLHLSSAKSGIWAVPFFADNKMMKTAVFSGSVADFGFRFPQFPLSQYVIRPTFESIPQNTIEIHAFSSYGLVWDRWIWRLSTLPNTISKITLRNIRGVRTTVNENGVGLPAGTEIELSNNGKSATFTLP